MALSITGSDTYADSYNSTSTNIDITLPAYSNGDLVIICYDLWNNSGSPTVTWANGPNGETVTNVINSYGSTGNDGLKIAIGYYIATANYAGGDMANDSSVSTRWAGAIIIVPSGEYDSTTPISTAVSSANSASDVTDLNMPAFTSGAADYGGKLLVFCGADQDPWNTTMPSGYTQLENLDGGRASCLLAGRDSAVGNSENIAAANFDLSGTGSDSIAIYAFIVREAGANMPPTVALNSPSDTGSTASITPDLTFTGSDTESNPLRYRLKLDTSSDFNSQFGATPAVVQTKTSSSSTAAFTSAVTAGNMILVAYSLQVANTTSAPTDTLGNTYHAIYTDNYGGNTYDSLYYAYNISGGSNTVTLHLDTTSWNIALIAREYSGLTTTDPFDKYAIYDNPVTTHPTSGDTATLTQEGELVVGVSHVTLNVSVSAGSGYGNLTTQTSVSAYAGMEDKVVTATDAVSATVHFEYTAGSAGQNNMAVATFKQYRYPLLDVTSIFTGSDKFDQTSLNTNFWTATTGGSATLTYEATGTTVTFPSSSTSSTIGQVASVSNINLTGKGASIAVLAMPSASTAANAGLRLSINENNWLRWVYESGTIYAQDMVSSSRNTRYSVAWNATTHKYLRIRESGGTTYWETSSDGSTWTVRHSRANPIAVTSLEVQINGYCYQNESNPGTFKFNDFRLGSGTITDSDYGFYCSGDVSEPFNAGQAVTYTIQVADELTDGETYYWAVQAIDPAGSNAWGDWSDTYSFDVSVPGAETYTIQKNLNYKILKSITLNRNLKYEILIVSTIQKNLAYKVIFSNAIQKDLKYEVIASVLIQKDLNYQIIYSPSVIQKNLGYLILTIPSALELDLNYSVKSVNVIQKTLNYKIKYSPSAIELNLKYQVKTTSTAINLDLGYQILNVGLINLDLGYAVKSSVAINKNLSYQVLTNLYLQKDLNYKILVSSVIQKDLNYSVITIVSSLQLDLGYQIKSTLSDITLDLNYKVKIASYLQKDLDYKVIYNPTTIQKDLGYELIIIGTISLHKTLKYTVLTTPSALQKSLTYKIVITPSYISKNLSYLVVVIQSIQKNLNYEILTVQNIQKLLNYKIINYLEAFTKSLGYSVLTDLTIQKELGYKVVAGNLINKQLNYAIAKSLYLQKSLNYSVKIDINIQKSLSYEIVTNNIKQLSLKYRVARIVITRKLELSLSYKIYEVRSLSLSLSYKIRNQKWYRDNIILFKSKNKTVWIETNIVSYKNKNSNVWFTDNKGVWKNNN